MKKITDLYLDSVDLIRKIPFKKVFLESINNQTLSYDELIFNQNKRINSILKYASKNIPGYTEKYKNIPLDKIDFSHIPFLKKEEIISFPKKYTATSSNKKKFYGSTSGSTGQSLIFSFDSTHAAWAEACKWRGRSWFGCSRGDPSIILWGRPVSRSKIQKNLIDPVKSILRNECLFNTFASMELSFSKHIFEKIERINPCFIYGYGSSIGRLATELYKNGTRLSQYDTLHCIQYTADHMSNSEKLAAREVLNAPVISDYGASELPGIAEECINGHLHISIDCYHVEVVNEDGRVIPDGVAGNLVVTSLHNRAMPFIRYQIGDIGRLIAGKCECGSSFPRMQLCVGKSIDLITTSFASKVSAHYLDYINIDLMNHGLFAIQQFKLYQIGRDKFELNIVKGKGNVTDALERFQRLLRKKLGPVEINVLFLNEIPLESTGKHTYFVNKI